VFDFSLGGAVADFFTRNLRHTKGPAAGEPFVPEWHQQDFLDEWYRCDEEGNRLYRSGLKGVPRGNGKTPECAAMALRDLRTQRDSPDIFVGSAAKDQGRILLDFARDFVEMGPLADRIHVQRNILTCERTRGVMQVVSADGALQHGKNISDWYGDELHAFTTPKQRELHVAMMTALKRPNSAGLSITTAGWDKATLLGEMYDGAMRGNVEVREDGYLLVVRDEVNGSLFWWRQVPQDADIEDPAVIRKANPASWVDVDALLKMLHSDSSGIGELEFRRLHCNQWTQSQAAWIPIEKWNSCIGGEEPAEGASVYVGVDASHSHDTTAVAWAWRLEDGRVALRAHVFSPRRDAPAHEYEPTRRVRMEAVREFIVDLGRRYEVREVAFDPAWFVDSADELSEMGFFMVQLDQQTKVMRDAEQHFHDAVMEQRVQHDGDLVVSEHLAAVVASRRPNGAWKIRPLDQVKAIDATVAMVIAHSRALREPAEKPLLEVLF
jgi:phage terminase large subunit-like protein